MPDAHPEQRLWERVHARLDARRDPLADRALARELAACPRVEREVRALVAALPQARAPRRRIALAAAALALAAALPLALRRPQAAPERADGIALEVVHGTPEPARGEVRRLATRPVLAWTRTGDRP